MFQNHDSVVLATEAGRRLRYGALTALAATGRTLPARLEVPEPERIRLVIEDTGAAYPLLIDPLLTSVADAFLESDQPDPVGLKPAAFGASVSSAGDVNGDGFDDVIGGAARRRQSPTPSAPTSPPAISRANPKPAVHTTEELLMRRPRNRAEKST